MRATDPVALGREARGDRLWLLLVAVTATLASCHALFDPDLWFHLRAGREIAAGHGIPRVDAFSYPSAGRDYIDLHWFYQLVTFWLESAGGVTALITAQMALSVATFLGLYRLARREASPAIAGFLTVAGIALASERFVARPESWSFLLLVLTQLAAATVSDGRRRAWLLLPAIFLLWANVEGVFVVGLGTLLALCLDRPRVRPLWWGLGASLIAIVMNPYGVTGALHPLVLFSRINRSLPLYSETIGEFLSPFHGEALHLSVALFPWYLAAIAVLLLGRARRPRLSELLLLGAFVYLGLSARRNLALLPLVATPILARYLMECRTRGPLGAWVSRLAGGRREIALGVVASLAIALSLRYDLALLLDQVYARAETNARFGFGLAPCAYPVEAAEFVRARGLRGPFFATMSASDYLLFARPEEKSFIDGRLEVHSAEHYERYLRILGGGEAFRRAAQEFGFRCLVLPVMDAPNLIGELRHDPNWACVHVDDTAFVFVRRDALPAGCAEITRESTGLRPWSGEETTIRPGLQLPLLLDPRPIRIPWSELNRGQAMLIAGWPDLAAPLFAKATNLAPRIAAPRVHLGACLSQFGQLDAAERELGWAGKLPMNRRLHAQASATWGFLHLSRNRPREALRAYDLALRDNPSPGERGPALVNRGLAKFLLEDRDGAFQDVSAGLKLVPGYLDGYRILGAIEERRGHADAARRAFEVYLRGGGTDATARAAYQRLTQGG